MIVDKNEGRRAMLDCPSEDRPGIKCELPDRAAMHLFVGDEPMSAIKEQDAKHFVWKRPHRGHEILAELRTCWVDRFGADFGLKTFEDEIAGAEQDTGYVLVLPKDALERLGRLRADPADAAKFQEQRAG